MGQIPTHAPVIDRSLLTMTDIWLALIRDLQSGVTSPTLGAGSVGTAELAAGAVTLAKLASVIVQLTGSRAAPTSISAAGGIAPAGKWCEVMWITGSGGPVTITANPQIASGTEGQLLILIGGSNAVTIADGTGTRQNGSMTLDQDDVIAYIRDGSSAWTELWRKDAA